MLLLNDEIIIKKCRFEGEKYFYRRSLRAILIVTEVYMKTENFKGFMKMYIEIQQIGKLVSF